MLKMMLCGASDTSDVSVAFAEVTAELGGETRHYLSGQILYRNYARAKWDVNSRSTVSDSDVCVFVILHQAGEITWNDELDEALKSGKPFVILCLESTYAEYRTLTRHVPAGAVGDENKRRLIEIITELELERNLTIATFSHTSFKDVYRREAAKLFRQALDALSERYQRESLYHLLASPEALRDRDLRAVELIAVDEFEDKGIRKMAIAALAARQAADVDTVLALLSSREQGVQRLAISSLPGLYSARPAEPEFMTDCVALANSSDDTGVIRRLIPALLQIDLRAALPAMAQLDLTEIGTRRRLATGLEEYEPDLLEMGLKAELKLLLSKCLLKSDDAGWLARCRTFLLRLDDGGSADNQNREQSRDGEKR
jgi:hypothetical protein